MSFVFCLEGVNFTDDLDAEFGAFCRVCPSVFEHDEKGTRACAGQITHFDSLW